ncbi:hypothetical protein WJX84_009086 [Apatococcus fuscideae]|uniref:SAP domain-containing protein n=1 Tax=Apatococcus fuscideae TaxID=2026836 RepID=A0AAW1T7Q8_9CHLO
MQLVGLAKAGPAQSFRSHKPGKQRQQTTRLQAAQQGVPSLKRVKKADLQEQLSAFGLSTDGKREELASRLEIHLSHLSHLEARALEQQSKQDEQSEVLDDVKEVAIDKLEDTTLTLDSLLSRTKAQLSTELASRGLPKSGLKADLAQRLFEAIETEGSSNDITDLPIESDAAAAGIDPLEAETQTAPGSVEPEQATSILDLVQSADPEEDTSHQIAPVPDYDAPDEDIATEGDSPPISLLEEPVPREQQPGILRDAEGTVIRANFGSGARTQDRFENAGTRAADVAESEMSPMGLEEDAQDGTNKAFQELQTEDTMDDEADTFVSEQRAGVGFDSPGDTGYKETIGPAGQVVIDSMQDPEAAELGMPGEDEAADPPENDAYAAAPDTLEELDAQLDEQQDEINAIQEERITDAYAESESTLGTVEPQTEDPELEASSERLATPAGTPQHGEAYASKLPFTGKSADAAAPSPSDLSQAAIAGRNARSESTAATPAANSLASDVSTGLASEAHDKLSGSTAVGSSAPESHTSAAASQGPQGSSILQTEDAELESPGQDDQTPQARGGWSQLTTGGQLSDELTQMQSKVDSRNEDVKQLQEKLAASHQEAADHTASIENMQAEMAQLRNEHVALSRQLEQTSHSHGPVSPYIKEELSKQLTALSSQVSHLQGEIMRRGQLSGQLHEQLQADLPVSYINGRASLSDPIGAISLRPSPTQSLITQETVSPTDTSKTSEQETATEQNQAGASSVDVDDQARQPGVVVAAGAMEFMRVGSKVSEAMGSVFNIFKQGLKGRKDD